jgi:hypothetical protein
MIDQLALVETEYRVVDAVLKQRLPILEAIILDTGRPGFVQTRMQDDASIATWLLMYLLHWVSTLKTGLAEAASPLCTARHNYSKHNGDAVIGNVLQICYLEGHSIRSTFNVTGISP